MGVAKHKPIVCSRCGYRMNDSHELPYPKWDGHRYVGKERVCSCGVEDKPYKNPFTSRPRPPDLDFYDKRNK